MRGSLLITLVLLYSTLSQAATLHVSQQGSGTNGLSWETAFVTISDALTASATGDHIWVREGVYPETLVLKDGVQVYGGFAGTEASDEFHLRNPKVHLTKIDGTDAVENIIAGARHALLDGFEIYALRRQMRCVSVVGLGNAAFHLANCDILDMTPTSSEGPVFLFLAAIGVTNSAFDCFNSVVREINHERVTGGNVFVDSSYPARFVNCIFLSSVKGKLGDTFAGVIPSICVASGHGSRIILNNCLLKITAHPGLNAYSIHHISIYNFVSKGAITGINNIFLTHCRREDAGNLRLHFSLTHNLHPWITDDHPAFVDEANEDFRLLSHSAGIDSGTFSRPIGSLFEPQQAHLLQAPDFDIRGKPRPVDIHGVGGEGAGAYDIGPFALQLDEYTLRSDLNGDGIVDDLDLIILARDWGRVSGP